MFPLQDHPRLINWSVPKEWEHRSWMAVVVAQWGLRDQNCVLYPHPCALSTGSRRHNSDQEDRCLPPPALEPGQTAANDGGDHGQRQGAGPHRAHLLAVHQWRTGAEAQVILPFLSCSGFWLSPGHPCCPLGPASFSRHWPGSQMSTLIQGRLLTKSWACVTQACYLPNRPKFMNPDPRKCLSKPFYDACWFYKRGVDGNGRELMFVEQRSWDGHGARHCIPDFSFNSPTSCEVSIAVLV